MIPESFTDLKARPGLADAADLDRARREWAILEPVLGSAEGLPAAFLGANLQPIHGDSPPFDLITTPDGERYADFEDAALGPVEWDLTLVGPDGEQA